MKSIRLVIVIAAAGLGLGGCAAIGISGAALGAGVFGAGAGAAVEAGKEYTRGGTVLRTFSLPLPELRLALGDALERMELAIIRDEVDGADRVIVAHARDREIEMRLEPVTRTVTRLRLVVAEGTFRKDRATATEIVVQTERSVEERTPLTVRDGQGYGAAPVRRAAPGTGASSLVRGGRR